MLSEPLPSDLAKPSEQPAAAAVDAAATTMTNSNDNSDDSSTLKENNDTLTSNPVYLFLKANTLLEQWPVFEQEGYELVEDLQELILPANKELFEKLVPKSGHRLRISRLLAPQQSSLRGGVGAANGFTKPSGRAYAASSRSTLLGDTDDENMSVADSIVSYTSRATMHATARGGMVAGIPTHHHQHHNVTLTNLQHTTQQQSSSHLHPTQDLLGTTGAATIPRVVSYPFEDITAAAGGGNAVNNNSISEPPTPSPSPQRSDFQRSAGGHNLQAAGAGAPSKPYLDVEGSQQRGGGLVTPRGQSTADNMSVRTVASKSPMRQQPSQRQRAPSDASSVHRGLSPQPQQQQAGGGNPLVKMKVVVVGQQGCGKTSLIHRLVRNEFAQQMKPTIGVEFAEKRFQVASTIVALHFWDIWGQEMAANATRTYYTGAKGAIVVYDASSEDSLQRAILWKRDLDAKTKSQRNGLPIPVILVGNKCDLVKTGAGGGANNMSLATAPSQGSFLAAQAARGVGGGSGLLVSFNGNDPNNGGGSNSNLPSLANFNRQHSQSSASLDRQDSHQAARRNSGAGGANGEGERKKSKCTML
ncbi:ras-related GTP-binding protein, putative [Bodo saltans]|uniref:Ras-related GTP-binding protein, putative n=1 Tax=Bodo saltans TaxID=75058 RepID=A0A0S4J6S8_BODSA|nr:ras-related GTP-binding protein, putative [Bodo saltans]|eukprot:CUG86919.1 ras-related GTP-binding protein, putative [Bodo saltans]